MSEKVKPLIGIDLGTSTSIITAFEDGGVKSFVDSSAAVSTPIIPSVVAFDPTNNEIAVGEFAENFPDCIREAKRQMGTEETCTTGGKTYKPEEVGAFVLKYLKSIAEQELGEEIKDVMLTVPAIFNDKARNATMVAGQIAKLNIVQLINEPVAAMLYYVHLFQDKWEDSDKVLLVFDFGGGTLDITVGVKIGSMLNILCSYGDHQLGGKDVDEMFMWYMLKKFKEENPKAKVPTFDELIYNQKSLLKRQVIFAKKQLSKNKSAKLFVAALGTNNGTPIDLDMNIQKEDFEKNVLCAKHPNGGPSIIERITKCLKEMFTQYSDKIKKENIDYVLMVGGFSYIPLVQERVLQILNKSKEELFCKDPDLAVSRGAAVFAVMNHLGDSDDLDKEAEAYGVKKEYITETLPVSPYGIGTDVRIDGSDDLYYDEWVAPQQEIPFSGEFRYRLITPTQKALSMLIFQSIQPCRENERRPISQVDNTNISNSIRGIPPASGEPHEVVAEVSYDKNGLLKAVVTIPSTGQQMVLEFIAKPAASKASQKRIDSEKMRGSN
ncbi:MAG: Hsp70 family protein [Planctomycetia bacterium]|nr:Hsp70 family protein [Planctomycetia bacterium]